jgi:hypothetical protein
MSNALWPADWAERFQTQTVGDMLVTDWNSRLENLSNRGVGT